MPLMYSPTGSCWLRLSVIAEPVSPLSGTD
jgi:hypothetical protein